MKIDKNTSIVDVAYNLSGSLAGLPAVVSQLPVGERIGFDTIPELWEDVADIGQTWTPDLEGMDLDFVSPDDPTQPFPVYNEAARLKAPFSTDLESVKNAWEYGNDVWEEMSTEVLFDTDFQAKGIEYGQGKFIALADNFDLAYTLDRGETWVKIFNVLGGQTTLCLRYLERANKWICGGNNGWISESNDGITWSAPRQIFTQDFFGVYDVMCVDFRANGRQWLVLTRLGVAYGPDLDNLTYYNESTYSTTGNAWSLAVYNLTINGLPYPAIAVPNSTGNSFYFGMFYEDNLGVITWRRQAGQTSPSVSIAFQRMSGSGGSFIVGAVANTWVLVNSQGTTSRVSLKHTYDAGANCSRIKRTSSRYYTASRGTKLAFLGYSVADEQYSYEVDVPTTIRGFANDEAGILVIMDNSVLRVPYGANAETPILTENNATF